jgi:hypothetical protein
MSASLAGFMAVVFLTSSKVSIAVVSEGRASSCPFGRWNLASIESSRCKITVRRRRRLRRARADQERVLSGFLVIARPTQLVKVWADVMIGCSLSQLGYVRLDSFDVFRKDVLHTGRPGMMDFWNSNSSRTSFSTAVQLS